MKRCFISDSELLEKLCLSLYDVLRPLIIHIIHLETLSELCSILKNEMLEDHVQNNGVLRPLPPCLCWVCEFLSELPIGNTLLWFMANKVGFLMWKKLVFNFYHWPLAASVFSSSVGGIWHRGEADAGGRAGEAGLQDAHLHPDWHHRLQTSSRRSGLSWETGDDGGVWFCFFY